MLEVLPVLNSPGARVKVCVDALDVRMVAARLEIPFYLMDLRDAFRRAVMDDLADNYLAGRTLNPCVMCNGVLKFQLGRYRRLGAAASSAARVG